MSYERKIKAIDVTPEIAMRWLEGNTHNRSFRNEKAEQYAEVMKAGKWLFTSEPIMFSHPWTDPQGIPHKETLIEGQHRLWGVVLSGVTVRFTVIWGCDPEEIKVIGQPLPRSQGDVLQITRRDLKDPTMIASVVSATHHFIFAKTSSVMTWQTELALRHFQPEIEATVAHKKKLTKLAPRPVQAAIFAAACVDTAKTEEAVERLQKALGFTERDPIRALHQYLHGQLLVQPKSRDDSSAMCYKTLHALLAALEGRTLLKPQPLIDHLGHARNLLKPKIDAYVRELHGGRLPTNFYSPRNSLRPIKIDTFKEAKAA